MNKNFEYVGLSGWRRKISKRLKKVRRTRRLIPMDLAISAGRAEKVSILVSDQEVSYPPKILWGGKIGNHSTHAVSRKMPEVALHRLKRVDVLGGTNFLLIGGAAVHPVCYLPARDVSPVELFGKAKMDLRNTKIKVPLGLRLKTIDRAFNLCDQTAGNYAHWMMEVLPKACYIGALENMRDVPVLVDGWIHQNHLDSLRTVLGPDRKIIGVPMFERIGVDELYDITPTAYCPHEFRSDAQTMADGFFFQYSPEAICKLRDHLRGIYGKYAQGRDRKIYIKNTGVWSSNKRGIKNIHELEDVIDSWQLETVNVVGYSIEEQAKVFYNARFIVAPSGAALANMIFAAPGCQILVMAAEYAGANYDYFHEMAHLLGHKLSYVVGRQTTHTGNKMHRQYELEVADFADALRSILHEKSVASARLSS